MEKCPLCETWIKPTREREEISVSEVVGTAKLKWFLLNDRFFEVEWIEGKSQEAHFVLLRHNRDLLGQHVPWVRYQFRLTKPREWTWPARRHLLSAVVFNAFLSSLVGNVVRWNTCDTNFSGNIAETNLTSFSCLINSFFFFFSFKFVNIVEDFNFRNHRYVFNIKSN